MLKEHKIEVCVHKDFIFDPNWELYKKCYDMGLLKVYVARDEGTLIGYIIFNVSFNSHYGAVLQAEQDVLYIAPAHRGKLLGIRLIKYADKALENFGVTLVVQHVKLTSDFSPILERLGYVMTKKIYERRLG